uniref:Solute carrier family 22 member 5-like n=1 Tax=Phallusia mammillata TaxID=59560 RepID=A0A6F9DT09_9ASCI|nr:solute carrier family 22 member 5-like [Phallusia mammillata]
MEVWKQMGKYERRLCVLLAVTSFTNPFSVLSLLFFHYTPNYHCDVTNIERSVEIMHSEKFNRSYNLSEKVSLREFLIPEETSLLGKISQSRCFVFNRTRQELREFAESAETMQTNNNTGEKIPCNFVEFHYEKDTTSAAQEFGMVCGNAWKKPMVGVNYMIGKFVGTALSGWISDKFGRKVAFFLFTFVQFAAACVISFSANFEMYLALVFCMGIGSVGNYAAAIMLGSETVGKQHRNFICSGISVGYAFGYMFVPAIAYFLQQWRRYTLATGLVGVIYIPFYWFIDESPRWLNAVGKTKKAEKILEKISKYNGRKIEMQKAEEPETKSTLKMWLEFLKSPSLMFRLLLTCSSWVICNMTYYAILFDTNSLTGSRFLNCFYAGVVELLAYIVSFATVERGGRKNTYLGFMVAAGLAIIVTPFIKLWSEVAVTILTMLSKLCVTVGYYVVYISTPELFPTALRHTTMSVASACGRFGGMLAPLIIFSGQNGDSYIPYLASGILTIIVSLLYILLPNTHNAPLPDSVPEAVQMENRKFCCFGKKLEIESKLAEEEIPMTEV